MKKKHADAGHAEQHFRSSGHSFSLELATGRVWSYDQDQYVLYSLKYRIMIRSLNRILSRRYSEIIFFSNVCWYYFLIFQVRTLRRSVPGRKQYQQL